MQGQGGRQISTNYRGASSGSNDIVEQLVSEMENLMNSFFGGGPSLFGRRSLLGGGASGGYGLGMGGGAAGTGQPTIAYVPLNVIDNQESYQVTAQLPGCDPNQIEVTISGDNILTIRAQQQSTQQQQTGGQQQGQQGQQGQNLLVQEFVVGQYLRTLQLPEHVDRDQIKANYNNGLLQLLIPKSAQHQQNQKKIQVQTGTGSSSGSGSGRS